MLLSSPYLGPNHGGRLEETKSAFAAFWVLMVQHDGIKVVEATHFAVAVMSYAITILEEYVVSIAGFTNATAVLYNLGTVPHTGCC